MYEGGPIKTQSFIAALTILSVLTSLWPSESRASEHSGIFGGFNLDLSLADVDTSDDSPEVGATVGLHVGYRMQSGLAFSGGFSEAFFDFDSTEMEIDFENELSADIIDLSLWYFLGLSKDLDLHLRVGAGRALGTFTTSPSDLSSLNEASFGQSNFGNTSTFTEEEKGFGLLFSAGLDLRSGKSLRSFAEINLRWVGLDFDVEGLDQDFLCLGLSVGLGWGR